MRIVGKNFTLRDLCLEDAELMYEWMSNPDIFSKMQYNPKQQSVEKCKDFIRKSWNLQNDLHLAVTDINDLYLGTVSLKNINLLDQKAEFAIGMHPKAMGTGAAKFALYSIIQYAFKQINLNKVYLYVRKDNIRAIKFYEKNHCGSIIRSARCFASRGLHDYALSR